MSRMPNEYKRKNTTNMKRLRVITLLLVTAFALPIHAQITKPDENQQPSLSHLMTTIHDLCTPEYEGRLAGTDAYMSVTDYVIDRLEEYGVEPYQDEWLQLFQIERNQIENATFYSYVNANDTRQRYVLGNDFCCASMTGRGYADAPVVFCGYGIDAAAFNEYANVDAQGKIVIVLSGVPNFLPSTVTDQFATIRDKAYAAQRHGACALVVINMSKSCPANEVQCRVFNGDKKHLAKFPIIQPTRACAEMLFQNELMPFQTAVDTIAATMKPQSFHLRKHFEIEVNAKYQPEALTANVIGIRPGDDKRLKNEYIVVGAHLDHVGMQGNTCLFPGADDNASGVAVLLETARMLNEAYIHPRRSVIFVLFSGSETEHLGSRIFVSNFSPLRRIEAFVNIECVGTGDSLVAMGNNKFPDLFKVACDMDSAFTGYSLCRSYKTNPKGDAAAFAKIGIPSLVMTNFNGNRHVHVPSDIPENIDRQFLLKAAKLTYETVYELTFGDYMGRTLDSRRTRFK